MKKNETMVTPTGTFKVCDSIKAFNGEAVEILLSNGRAVKVAIQLDGNLIIKCEGFSSYWAGGDLESASVPQTFRIFEVTKEVTKEGK